MKAIFNFKLKVSQIHNTLWHPLSNTSIQGKQATGTQRMHCASALRFQFLDRCVPVSPSSSSILIATFFTLPVCPSSLYGGSSYEFWHVGAGSAGCRLVETQHLLRGAHSLHEGEKVFCTAAWKAGHAADRGKSSQMIFLDTLVGKLAAFYYQFDLGI